LLFHHPILVDEEKEERAERVWFLKERAKDHDSVDGDPHPWHLEAQASVRFSLFIKPR
jgi:hypothetical protein